MTTATPPSPTVGPAGGDVDPVTTQPAERPARRRRSLWWRVGYPVALVLLVLAIPVLVWAGMKVILASTDGQLVTRVTDPTAPGYEALVEPTPTALVVSVDADGKLDTGAVLARTSDGAGGVLSIPSAVVVPSPAGYVTLQWVYDNFGLEAYRSSVGSLLDLSFGDVQVVKAADWATLVGPAAPITVNSPDPVVGPNGAVLFPKGSIELTAAQVWPYLSGQGANESDLARLVRVQAFWRAWLARIGTGGAAALGVAPDSALGQLLLDLGDDQVQYETLPVKPYFPDASGNEQFVVDEEGAMAAVAAIIPFPEGAPGARPRLRVLDGTGQLNNGVGAAITLAAAGAQVDVVGNARSFGQSTTQFVYYDDVYAKAAEDLRDALGVGEVVKSEQTNSATDLTVVLGDDYLAAVGPDSSGPEPSTLGGQGG